MKVIEGLRFGNECLNKMHQVSLAGLGKERKGSQWNKERVSP